MIRPSYPRPTQVAYSNAVSIPTEEFYETFQSLRELLEHDTDPNEFIVEDPFISRSCPVKVDLRKHLQSLYNRMSEINQTVTDSTQMVTIDFD